MAKKALVKYTETAKVAENEQSVKITKDQIILNGSYRVPFPSVNDYIIAQPDAEKPKKELCKVVGVKPNKLKVEVQKGWERDDTRQVVVVGLHQCLINLGPDITDFWGMSLMGAKVETCLKVKDSLLGKCYFFDVVDEKDWKQFLKGQKYIKQLFEQYGFDKRLFPLEFEFRKPGGAISGTYSVRPEKPELITIKLKEYTPDTVKWLLLHEFGHGIQSFLMSGSEWVNWIKLFHKFVNVSTDPEAVSQVMQGFITEGEDYSPDDDKQLILDECLAYISEKHFLDTDYLYTLIKNGEQDYIRGLWPKHADIGVQADVITEYSKKNPDEFWCESFSFAHMEGKERWAMPKVVKLMVKNTIDSMSKRAKAGKVKTESSFDKVKVFR